MAQTTSYEFTGQIDNIVSNGGTVTRRYTDTKDRWEAFRTMQEEAQATLNAAILNPDNTPDQLANLYSQALAHAQSTPITRAEVKNASDAYILQILRGEYAKVARKNYDIFAGKFNKAWADLQHALQLVDPDANADQVMGEKEQTRQAWMNIPVLTRAVDRAAGLLAQAAELAGAKFPAPHASGMIGLTVNADGLHRRRVWEAYTESSSRAGCWHALQKLGAAIEAASLETYKPYREPAPMETKQVWGGIGVRQEPYDPEDDAYNGI